MKLLLFIGINLFAFTLSAQYTRSFYSTDQNSLNHSTIVDVNGTNYFVSIKESKTDTIIIVTGIIDHFGETSNYSSLEYVLPSSNYYSLLGADINQNGDFVLTISYYQSSNTKILYIKTDGVTISQTYSDPELYKNGYSRSQYKNDSVITYLALALGGISRISTSLMDISMSSAEIVDATLTYNSPSSIYNKRGELLLDGTDEYFISGFYIFKRIGLPI